ncbi:MAG: AAA-like domain-containing protein [Coleofasciculus sp. G3-WIS-01]|uniref:AAA-like domain-containing protein n=1 Tax=Coleofasciculus sp. G3-WIS-01 TaxID=3069528 RepID=UPI0032F20BAC
MITQGHRPIDQVLECIDTFLVAKTGHSLSYIQKAILWASWQDEPKTYDQISLENGYSANYIKQGVAPKLWRLLSKACGEKVNKTNFRSVLERKLFNGKGLATTKSLKPRQVVPLEVPEGQVALNSIYYIERSPLESDCYQQIRQPATILRLEGSQQMGKTSLMARILADAQKQNYRTVRLSLHQAESPVFSAIAKFLRWFCVNVTRQLGLEPKLDEYWDEEMGCLISCTLYFQDYLLSHSDRPLVLAVDEVNQVLQYPAIAGDFLALLHSWQDDTKDIPVFSKLRLVLVHSTEGYLSFHPHQSLLTVGLGIQLPPFTREQVFELAKRHQLYLSSQELDQLMGLLAGFPYLVRLMFYEMVKHQVSLKSLLETVATDTGIYGNHLHRHLWRLRQYPDLAVAYQQVLKANDAVELDPIEMLKLHSFGLVRWVRDRVVVSCQLYEEYFRYPSNSGQ